MKKDYIKCSVSCLGMIVFAAILVQYGKNAIQNAYP